MSSITIHSIDGELDRRLAEEAKKRKKSKNSLVKDLLARSLGLPSDGVSGGEYSEFCGLWSDEEHRDFEAATADNEAIDEAAWS